MQKALNRNRINSLSFYLGPIAYLTTRS